MKKTFILLVAGLVMAACGGNKTPEKTAAELENDSLREVLSQQTAELESVMTTFNEIEAGFREINKAQDRVDLARAGSESLSQRERIREDMQLISNTLQENTRKISELQAKLRNGEIKTAKLRETIESLTAQLEEKTKQLEQLRAELDAKDIVIADQSKNIEQLNTNVEQLTNEGQQKDSEISKQDQEIHTAYYVFGTKSELKSQKILDGSEVLRRYDFNQDYFTKVDTRQVSEIKLYSKSATVKTNHPIGTYTLDKDAKGYYSLHIINAQKFWSASKYLVIIVK